MTWMASLGHACGACGLMVPAGAPLALVTRHRLPRCESCAAAMGGEIDWPAVDASRAAYEQAQARVARAAAVQILPRPGRPARMRPLVPLADIAGSIFDPKAAAANDRDEPSR